MNRAFGGSPVHSPSNYASPIKKSAISLSNMENGSNMPTNYQGEIGIIKVEEDEMEKKFDLLINQTD